MSKEEIIDRLIEESKYHPCNGCEFCEEDAERVQKLINEENHRLDEALELVLNEIDDVLGWNE